MKIPTSVLRISALNILCLAASAQSAPRFGVGVTASTLGIGIQGAAAITTHANLRAGFNIFDYEHGFAKDGVGYKGDFNLRSVQLTYDHFFGAFHISPGVLVYNGNSGSAVASVPGGQPFTLGGTTFYSSSNDPVNGTGRLSVNKAAPMILIGFGNLVPRSSRHFGINAEAGVVFQGSPNVKLNLGGTTCLTSSQTACVNTAANPVVQASLVSEQSKLTNDLSALRYYPVVSIGFSYKF